MTYVTPFIRFVAPASKRSVPASQRLRALLAFIATLVGAWQERTRARWELRRLAVADEHVLRDIGLIRSEVLRAGMMSLWP